MASIAIKTTDQVQKILKFTFCIVPIVAGVDKFTNLLTDWKQYLNPSILNLLPFSAGTFMMLVGIIEIVAGIIVFWRPRVGAFVVMGWLSVIALTLIAGGRYFDVAVRDLVMAVSAYSLAKLSPVASMQPRVTDTIVPA